MSTSSTTTVGTITAWVDWHESVSGTTFSYQPEIIATTTKNAGDTSIPCSWNLYLNGTSITSGSGTAQYYPDGYGKGPYTIDTWATRTVTIGSQPQTIRLYEQFTNFFGGDGNHYTVTLDKTLTVPATASSSPNPPTIVNDDSVDAVANEDYWVYWIFNTKDGSSQTAYEIAYGTTSSTTNTTGKILSSDNKASIPTASYQNNIYYKVRTWGSSSIASDWSSVRSVSISSYSQHHHKFLNILGLDAFWLKIKTYIGNLLGGTFDDYVLDSGTKDGWYYILWASGKIDAWIDIVVSYSSGSNFYFQDLPFTMLNTDYLVFMEVPSYNVDSAYAAWETGTWDGHSVKGTSEFVGHIYASSASSSSNCRFWIHGDVASTPSNVLTVTSFDGTVAEYTSGTLVITRNTDGTITTETINLG